MKIKNLLRSIILLIPITAVVVSTSSGYSFRKEIASTPDTDLEIYKYDSLTISNNKTSESVVQETFYAIADSAVDQFRPEDNFSDSVIISGGKLNGSIQRSLIHFYIATLPSDQIILGAKLRLYHSHSNDRPDVTRIITTYRILTNWAEDTVTWNNAPAYAEAYGSSSIITDVVGWYEFDVTNLVRGWYDGTYQNYGIMLRGDEISPENNTARYFWSREGLTVPELVIQYEPKFTPPTISGLPDQVLPVDTNRNNAIDLWAYTNDAQDADAALIFSINNTPNPSAGVSINSNRYIDINPSTGWTGVTSVEIKVTDTDGLSNTDSFQVTVIAERIILPIVHKE